MIQENYCTRSIPVPYHVNAFTIDVEDYFMVSGFADVVSYKDWHRHQSRIENNTHTLLHLLAEYGVRGTFFVLGWVAEHYPALVRDIHNAGHEIACHGYNHRLIYNLTPEQFREDVRMAKDVLENLTGTAVKGYRAASYSVIKETLWALDILLEEGYQYDSSIFPIHHDRYGFAKAERFPHVVKTSAGEITEFPPSTYRVLGQNIPVAGGGYFRLFPLHVTKTAIHHINKKEKKMAMIYIHPWEIDLDQPRLNGRWSAKMRHYIKLHSTLPKLRSCLQEFKFQPLSLYLK